jgi:F0F1-type ATP synthase membrane subunit c/vacuolar-type H+-ATPase subunit K
VRKAPINYIITIVVISVLWIGAAIFIGKYISENAALSEATPEEFSQAYLIVMSIGAAAAVIGASHWYWHGSRDAVAAEPRAARRFWSVWFFILIIASVACVAGMIITFIHESFTLVEYLIMFGCASLLTWIPFWVCSMLMSPRGVRPAVYGMR